MNTEELLNNKKELANTKDILKDVLSSDPKALARLDSMNLDMNAIKTALDFLKNNPNISDKEKASLVGESWRITFKQKPLTPQEFLTEAVLGQVAVHTYDRIKKNFLEFTDPTSPKRNLILYPHISYGKLLAPSAFVYTPSGPIEIQNIQVGDKVCDASGNIVNVINKRKFENEKIYKVTFSDGRRVYAGANHFWKAARTFDSKYYENGILKKGLPRPCWKLVTTQDIVESITEKKPVREWVIPLTMPANHTRKRHIISPYILGAYLGDGSYSSVCTIIGDDYEIHERIINEADEKTYLVDKTELKENKKSSVKYETRLSFRYKCELDRLGLANCKCDTKFIPDSYLYDCIENRVALLQGLMDTDGTVENVGKKAQEKKRVAMSSFWTSSERLADNVATLVRGLGGTCRVFKYEKGTTKATKNYDAYVITFNFPENRFPTYHLQRKQHWIDEAYNRDLGYKQQRKPQYLHFKSIEETDITEGYCIETDGEDHLFLCDDYIVTHNSYLTVLINLYFAVRLAYMRDPWKLYGLNPSSQIVQFLCSFSLKKSSELLLEPFNAILESATGFFEKIHTREKMVQLNEEIKQTGHMDKIYYTTAAPTSALEFAGGSSIKLVSNPQGLLGASCIGISYSELAFFTQAGKSPEYIMELYNKGKARVDSRFHGAYNSYTILDSSPNSLDNAIDHYINFDAPRDPSNMIIKGAMWETMPEAYDFSHTFKVYIGGAGASPKILSDGDPLLSDERYKNKIIDVPESERQFFVDDIVNALKDRGGIPSGSAGSLISNYDKLEQMFKYNLKNIYECIHAPSELSPSRLIFNQVKDTFFRNKANKYEFYYKPNIPRCIAVDQSYSTDMTGISMCHVERFMDTGELIYVVDFTIAIAPTKDSHINLDAIRCFIEELRDIGNLRIEAVGFDSFQSEPAMQHLDRAGFKVKKVSADKSMDPYMNMISLMNSGRIAVGKNIFLKNNLKSLSIINKKSKMKVDHDTSREVVTVAKDHSWANSPLGMYSKDISDSMVDAIELCRTEFPIAEEQWWGPIKEEDLTPVIEKSKAEANLRKFMSNFGLK